MFRVEDCIRNGTADDIDCSIDKGVWFSKKFPAIDPIIKIPTTDWKDFPSHPIPASFCYGHINQFAESHMRGIYIFVIY